MYLRALCRICRRQLLWHRCPGQESFLCAQDFFGDDYRPGICGVPGNYGDVDCISAVDQKLRNLKLNNLLNPKSEILNSKQILNSNLPNAIIKIYNLDIV
jgi:hypothetical protein